MTGGGRPPARRSRPRRAGSPDDEPEVFLADEQTEVTVEIDRLHSLSRYALAAEGVRGDVELGVVLVDEETIARMNSEHMGAPGPTDVLAFPIDDEYAVLGRSPDGGPRAPENRDPTPSAGPLLLGDVVICPAVAARNAEANAGSYPGHAGRPVDEIDLLLVHGVLHVLGHDHAEEGDAATMRERELSLLAGFPRSPAGPDADGVA